MPDTWGSATSTSKQFLKYIKSFGIFELKKNAFFGLATIVKTHAGGQSRYPYVGPMTGCLWTHWDSWRVYATVNWAIIVSGSSFVAFAACHYLNQWGLYVIWTIGDIIQWNFNFHTRNSISKCHLHNGGQVLDPSYAIRRYKTWLALVQVLACGLTARSHSLKQCWFVISKAQGHSSGDTFTGNSLYIEN